MHMHKVYPCWRPRTASWEELDPSSFKTTLYIPNLSVAIAAGSFILYDRTGRNNRTDTSVASSSSTADSASNADQGPARLPSDDIHELLGRIIEVVDSVEGIEDPQITLSFRNEMVKWKQNCNSELPVQSVKVNLLKDHSLFSKELFPGPKNSLSGESMLAKSR